MNISGLTVSNGHAPDGASGQRGGDGGGIKNTGTLTLTGVAVSGNRAGDSGDNTSSFGGIQGGNGGGIYSSGMLTILNSTVSGNQTGAGGKSVAPAPNGDPGDGGGVYTIGSATTADGTGTLTAVNSTFSGNTARIGGGMWIQTLSPARLTNCTVAFNSATQGAGGVASFANITVGNTIIGSSTNGLDASGAFTSQGHNIVGFENGLPTGFCCFFTQPTDRTGTEAAPFDPKLGPLADNGGSTLTHAPLAGSAALDGGDNALAKDPNNLALTTDQRGAGRYGGAGHVTDIGAYEFHPSFEDVTGRRRPSPSSSATTPTSKGRRRRSSV